MMLTYVRTAFPHTLSFVLFGSCGRVYAVTPQERYSYAHTYASRVHTVMVLYVTYLRVRVYSFLQ